MTARAIVKLTVEITMSECWGDDWKLTDVYKSAADSAINLLNSRMGQHHNLRILGAPEVTSVLTESKK